ncbi:MAG: hypothetical protein GYA17_06080 [Chloroflexi bacterium]|nr:hypothetical protein [Chloroflexota bacterium]
MKRERLALNLTELVTKFSGQKYVFKSDLRIFYHSLYTDFSEPTFRRILYALEKQNVIIHAGRGTYVLQDPHSSQTPRKQLFIPTLSAEIIQINREIKETFPYTDYLLWETNILHEFMLHQPGQNYIILECEKETENSIFNHLNTIYPGNVFLYPGRTTIERYALQQKSSIFVSNMFSQTPKGKKVREIPYAKPEKILVDLLVDDEKFFLFHGKELAIIFENIFDSYLIDEKSLIRYAGRRNAISKLKQFVQNQTQIKLERFNEASHDFTKFTHP